MSWALLMSKLISTLLVLLTESSNGLNAATSCRYDSSLGMFILFSHLSSSTSQNITHTLYTFRMYC